MTKKKYILEKAEELFAQRGCDATTVRHIAKAAGINIAMVSYYFGSKEKLVEALFNERMEQGYNYTTAIVNDASLSPYQKIEKLIEGYVWKVKTHQKFYQVVLAEQVINSNKKIVTMLESNRKHFLLIYDKILDEGIANNMFSYKPDPVLLMTTVTGTLMQCILNKKFYSVYHNVSIKTEEEIDAYFEAVKNYILVSIKRLLGYEED